MNQTVAVDEDGKTKDLFAGNVFTATLVSSRRFQYRGRAYDMKKLFPNGVTQWGMAGAELADKPEGYDSVVPFAASAIVI